MPSKQGDSTVLQDKQNQNGVERRVGTSARFQTLVSRYATSTGEDAEKALSENDLKRRFTREAFHDAAELPAVVLINNSRFEDLTVRDFTDLFNVLERDNHGLLHFDEIKLFLKQVIDPPFTPDQVSMIYNFTDMNEHGCISPAELHRAFIAGPVQQHFRSAHKETMARRRLEKTLGTSVTVERSHMVDAIKRNVERDDAFQTLPLTVFFVCIFTFLVIQHLQVHSRQQVERGVQQWLEAYGGSLHGPFLREHIADIPQAIAWLLDSGLPALLGKCTNSTEAKCSVGAQNLLLGDVKLVPTCDSGLGCTESVASIWLLNSVDAQLYLQSTPVDFVGAAQSVLRKFGAARSTRLAHQSLSELRLEFFTYGIQSQMFTRSQVAFKFDDCGLYAPIISIWAVIVRPYPTDISSRVLCALADMMFVLFIVYVVVKELRDLVQGMRIAGICDGFLRYWGPWNFVDWVNIAMCSTMIVLWVNACQAMNDDAIQALLLEKGDKLELTPRSMSLDVGSLEIIREKLTDVINVFHTLRVVVSCCSVSFTLKFFKAFQANPRLAVVTDTLRRAGSDIIHFFIVFFAVFVSFAVTGHIFLGNDYVHFQSIVSSLDTCFIALMGEHDWYVAASKSDKALRSGFSPIVLQIWFWSFMVFVGLLLLNMLLAIILGHYTQITQEVKQDPDCITLRQQTMRYISTMRSTKSHIPLSHLLCRLQDADSECHVGSVVNLASLKAAFPKMKHDQAAWLMGWFKREAHKLQSTMKESEAVARLKELETFFDCLVSDVHIAKLNIAICTSKLKGCHDSSPETPVMSAADSHLRHPDFGRQESLRDQVERLRVKVNKAVRDMTWQISSATDQLLTHAAALEDTVHQASLNLVQASQQHSSPLWRSPFRTNQSPCSNVPLQPAPKNQSGDSSIV